MRTGEASGPPYVVEQEDRAPVERASAATLAAEINARRGEAGGRIIAGFAGPPGSGKSTLAEQVCAELGDRAVLIPLDGWHLSAALTKDIGASERRGAPHTFDVAGFLVLLRRIRAQSDFGEGPTIYAPEYRRDLEEPVAGAIAVDVGTPIVVVEGNYLLLDCPAWRDIHPLLDLSYYVQLDTEERQQRLLRRHVEFGKSSAEAARWVQTSDERNARLIEQKLLQPTRFVHAP
ncbi:nucleoside/nucleotide kinase family protein [Oryzobacter telluris]|uniref:nucleoside/nucleotide kinase family protein n=1 Tax=Oryzobacter telluris TaxID=3149179 RepID=UPI00370D4712